MEVYFFYRAKLDLSAARRIYVIETNAIHKMRCKSKLKYRRWLGEG